MSLTKGFDWSYDQYNFKGYSIAGQATSLVFQNSKICFDIAQGLPFNISSKLFCLTHLHSDHASGISYLLSQRSLFNLPEATIMLPKVHLDSVDRILKEWMKIEEFKYSYHLLGVEEGFTRRLNDKYSLKVFPTTHRIDSFGYLLYENKKKLKDEYKNFDRKELMKLKNQNMEIDEKIEIPLIAFTGDTQIEFLDSHPDIKKAKILFMECTSLDNKKSVEEIRKWGHTHLDEIVPRINEFQNEHICLIHLSARYSTPQAEQLLSQKLPEEFLQKLSIFPRPY